MNEKRIKAKNDIKDYKCLIEGLLNKLCNYKRTKYDNNSIPVPDEVALIIARLRIILSLINVVLEDI